MWVVRQRARLVGEEPATPGYLPRHAIHRVDFHLTASISISPRRFASHRVDFHLTASICISPRRFPSHHATSRHSCRDPHDDETGVTAGAALSLTPAAPTPLNSLAGTRAPRPLQGNLRPLVDERARGRTVEEQKSSRLVLPLAQEAGEAPRLHERRRRAARRRNGARVLRLLTKGGRRRDPGAGVVRGAIVP